MEKSIANEGSIIIDEMQKIISLGMIDFNWKEHLREMDDLKQSVQSAVYEQKDPLVIYKFEGFELFKKFIAKVNQDTVSFLTKAQIPIQNSDEVQEAKKLKRKENYVTKKEDAGSGSVDEKDKTLGHKTSQVQTTQPIKSQKVFGRNSKISVRYEDGRIIKDPKTSWWEKLPFVSISKSRLGKRRNQKNANDKLLSGQSAIRVDANLDGVPIYIDGRYVGHTPLKTPIRVEPGWHQVSGFSPQYLMYLNTGTIDYVSNDPMLHNQIFGTETLYVEGGKIARSEMRFDYVGPSLPVKKKNGGWLVGFPVVMTFFYLLSWGVA